MSLHSAGLPGRVKRDPDGLRCRDSVLLGAAGNLCAPRYTKLETESGLGTRTGKCIYIWKDPANELAGYPYYVPSGTG